MESFTLEPLDTAALQRQHQEKAGRGKRKRRLVIDDPKAIRAQLSSWLSDGDIDVVLACGSQHAIVPDRGARLEADLREQL